jgi:thymidylate kinase
MKTKDKTICIEFVGIWGSGKTTIINQISKTLSEKGLMVAKDNDYSSYSQFLRYKYAFFLFFFNPIYFLSWLRFSFKVFLILKPRGKIEIDIYKTLIKANIKKNFLLLKKCPDVLLLEGAFHLFPVFKKMRNISNKDLLFSISTIGNCSKSYIAFVETNLEIALNRVIANHKNKLQRFSNEELKNLKGRYLCMMENQKKILNIIHGQEIILLNGEKSVASNSSYLHSFILNSFKLNS